MFIDNQNLCSFKVFFPSYLGIYVCFCVCVEREFFQSVEIVNDDVLSISVLLPVIPPVFVGQGITNTQEIS